MGKWGSLLNFVLWKMEIVVIPVSQIKNEIQEHTWKRLC